MIVYKDDWKYYPDAIVDTKTINTSFLKIAKVYKDMGVDHWYFCLALLQPELQGVDPFSETLTLEQKAKILYECDNNPWYYLREISGDRSGGITREEQLFQANRGNIAAMWLLLACIDYIQIQPRQTGKSFGTDVNTLWLTYFCYRDTQLNLITKDETLRKTNVARYKKIRDAWPDYINRNTRKDDNNQISISCNELDNKIYTNVSQSSDKGANNLGRGMSSPYVQVDEGPFINHIETTISAAMGSMNALREITKRKGKPYCTVFTSTAGNRENRDGKYMYEIWQNAARWSEHFYDAPDRDSLVKIIKKGSRGRGVTVNLTLTHRQLGKSDEWLYDAIARARSEGSNVDRDYFNTWTSSSTNSLLSDVDSKAIKHSIIESVDTWISSDSYVLRWYEEWDPNKQYVLSIDTSDAIGRDDIANVMIDAETGRVVATAQVNETNLIQYADFISEIIVKYSNVLVAPERKHNAQAIIDRWLMTLPYKGIDPYKRIYNSVVQNKLDEPERYDEVFRHGINRSERIYNKYKNTFGFMTTGESRKLLYGNVLMNAVKYSKNYVRDATLIHQILSLVNKNGRIDHADGEHDDHVIAWLIGHWVLNYGTHWDDYGFKAGRILTRTENHKTNDENPEDAFQDQQRTSKLRRVDEIKEIISNPLSTMELTRYEAELTTLLERVDSDKVSESYSLGAILEDARTQRSVQKRRTVNTNTFGNRKASALLSRYGR